MGRVTFFSVVCILLWDLFVSISFSDLSKDTATVVAPVWRIDSRLDLLYVNQNIGKSEKKANKKGNKPTKYTIIEATL